MTDHTAAIAYDYAERMGICIHEGALTEAQAHEIAAAQVVQQYGQKGREWLKLEDVKRTLV